jgi:hypothetical protein
MIYLTLKDHLEPSDRLYAGWEGGTTLCFATQPNLKKDDTLILSTERVAEKMAQEKKTMWNTIQVDVQTVDDQIAIINLAGDLIMLTAPACLFSLKLSLKLARKTSN